MVEKTVIEFMLPESLSCMVSAPQYAMTWNVV